MPQLDPRVADVPPDHVSQDMPPHSQAANPAEKQINLNNARLLEKLPALAEVPIQAKRDTRIQLSFH